MKLIDVHVHNYRNILDSNLVQIQDNVTCLVGKNESGKTAFLEALYRLFPARPNVNFSAPDHYPAWLEKKDRMRGVKLEEFRPIKATFKFETKDIEVVEKQFGKGVLKENVITLQREYCGKLWYTLEVNESVAVKEFVSSLSMPATIANQVKKLTKFEDLAKFAEGFANPEGNDQEVVQSIQELREQLKNFLNEKKFIKVVWEFIEERVPQFFYFAEYSTLPYTVKIKELLKADPSNLDDDELTALSLLKMAGAEEEYLLNPDYERRKRELENVANALTEDVLKYWSQNPELRVQPDITQITKSTPQGQQSVLDELKIRIWDNRHQLSLAFDEHSTGFQWFFSFLAAFSEYEYKKIPVVILLDEPALGLHARAQADFLRFIDERLVAHHQVIYTTHSPFMVEPGKLERARVVEDRGRDEGSKITADVLTTDKDTLFPLQGALGYDLVQHMFINTDNLIVEGTSDFTYIQILSDYFRRDIEREALDERWSIVPVGSADLIPTFVALLGHHLDITVVVDSRKAGHQKLSHLAAEGHLAQKRIITIGQILSSKLGDVEDLFSPGDYLKLYNRAFNKHLKVTDITGSDPIVSRIARHEGVDRFDHGKPADVLLRERTDILLSLSQQTLDMFEKLFKQINATFSDNGNKS